MQLCTDKVSLLAGFESLENHFTKKKGSRDKLADWFVSLIAQRQLASMRLQKITRRSGKDPLEWNEDAKSKKIFPCRELNPGLLGESEIS